MKRELRCPDGAVVATEVEMADSMWSRFCGLMMRKDFHNGQALILSPCSSIHMFFMRFPIDVAFVDRDGKILHALHSIRPWRMSRMVFHAVAAIELPAGTMKGLGIGSGDTITLHEDDG